MSQQEEKRGVIPDIKHGHMASPSYLYAIDRNVFKKTPKEIAQLATIKQANKDERKAEYGKDANKHLNCSARSLGASLHFTF